MKLWHIVVIIVCVLALGFYTQPKMQNVQTLESKFEGVLEEKSALSEQIEKVQEIKKEKKSANEDYSKRIPQENEQEKLIFDIRRLTMENGFAFNDVSFVKGYNPIIEMPEIKASFSTQGNKNNLLAFLKSIEANERFMGMESMSITTREEGQNDIVSFQVSLYAFYEKES